MSNQIIPYTGDYQKKLIEFIGKMYLEIDDRICLNGYDNDLLDISKYYFERKGQFWLVINDTGEIMGSIACRRYTDDNSVLEMKRLYLDKYLRGKGVSDELFQIVCNWANQNNFKSIVLWSDVRYTTGHRFFNKLGFVKKHSRIMNDAAQPYQEYKYELKIN